MSIPWRQWEGQVVDGCFPLRRLLGCSDRSAVFLTLYGDVEPRDAAIKLVVAEAQDAELLSQWERAAQLEHPHLLRLWRMGRWQANQLALDYVVTEYAEENLAAVLAERPLTAAEVRELLPPVLDALAYIHGEGLVYGHLKPANLMASGDQLKLAVDGISWVGDWDAAASQPGPYDPPEFQDRGASPVGDTWSLGVTLVEALTRQLPTQADPRQEPVLPATMPAEFVAWARACLQPDPRRRATPGGLAARLRQPAEPPRQPPAPAPKSLLRRRGPMLVAGVGCALAALLAGPRLLHRPASSDTVATQPAPAPPQPEHQVPKVETPPITQEIGGEEANAVESAPPAPPVTPPGGRVDKERKSAPERPGPASAAEQTTSPAVDHAGAVVRQVLPDVPEKARNTIHGKVTVHVRASVDSSGHVTSARLESRGSRYLSNLTLEAARQWVFEPAAGEWLLRFEITSKGTAVQTSRVLP